MVRELNTLERHISCQKALHFLWNLEVEVLLVDHHPIGHIWFEHDHNRVLLQIRVIDLGISTL